MGETITIADPTGDAKIPVYVATPAGEPVAAILVIPEIFGINAGIRKKADDWASLGYLAVAPDIFWRFAPGVELDPDVPEQMQEAFGYFGQFDPDLGIGDIATLIAWLRSERAIAKIGLVGFCLGGRLAYMAATRTSIDVAVGYYGVMIDTLLDEASAIAKPLALHIPTADHFVSPEAQAAIHAGLDPNPLVTLWDYPGLDHGFAAETGNRRNPEAATIADERTRAFLAKHLA